MEQITVTLAPFTRRSRSLAVSHQGHDLSRGLDPGEHVLLHDAATGEHFSAVVSDVYFEMDDTSYRLTIGGQITAAEAAEWLTPSIDDDRLTTRDLVDLLTELRRGEREISAALDDLRAR